MDDIEERGLRAFRPLLVGNSVSVSGEVWLSAPQNVVLH